MIDLTLTTRDRLKRLTKGLGSPIAPLAAALLAIGCLLPPGTAKAEAAPEVAGKPAPEVAAKPAYRLGVFPYLPALTIDRLYGPLAESLSLELDRLVKLRTKSTFENFAEAIELQSYDILFVHPFFFVDAVDHHDYLPLARLDQSLKAILVATEDSSTSTLDHLVGQTIGLPPKLAAVSKLIKSALMDEGLRPGLDVGIRHFRNKASCLQAVGSGAVVACGVPAFILSEIETFANRPLRTIFEAPPVSHFAFAIHSRVPEEERQQLMDLILAWGQDDDEGIGGFAAGKSFVSIEDADYANIRAKTTRLQTLAQR
ncbi:MAG: PhnD/SsuA/transferrin family substrate-binding protein [Geminicoccaceae bacterium]